MHIKANYDPRYIRNNWLSCMLGDLNIILDLKFLLWSVEVVRFSIH